jgi:hypothetical protein
MTTRIFPPPPSDFDLAVREGKVPGTAAHFISGHATGMGTVLQTIWSGGATVASTALLSTPATVKVSSSSGTDAAAQTGALTALLSGVDATNVAISETITLTGQTEVTSSNTYKGINGLVVATAGTGLTNAGDLWVGNGSVSSGVPATKFFITEAGDSNSDTCTYTVPDGKIAYLTQMIMMIADTAKSLDLTLHVNNGSVRRTIAHFELGQGDFVAPIRSAPGVAAGNLISVEGQVSTSTADVSVLVAMHLVDV